MADIVSITEKQMESARQPDRIPANRGGIRNSDDLCWLRLPSQSQPMRYKDSHQGQIGAGTMRSAGVDCLGTGRIPIYTWSGDGETPEQHDLHHVQAKGQDDCRAENVGYDGCRQRRHQDALGRERAEKRYVEDGRRDQPGAGPGTPQIPTLARDIEDRLAAVHQRNNRQRAQSIVVEAEGKASDCKTGDTEDEIAKP
jgi:hypothetical protein